MNTNRVIQITAPNEVYLRLSSFDMESKGIDRKNVTKYVIH